ncbi:MAG: divalent-cation tolerance protein CutA [Gammaproteobacteria bacterium]|nr:divalent-cation tolerance protein CutA [Gammaproteobacteria bacterium]
MQDHYLVITSWPDLGGAKTQARHWLQKKLVASVNILPKMDSIYVWQEQPRQDTAHKILIKTCAYRIDALQRENRAAHPYVIAEIPQF